MALTFTIAGLQAELDAFMTALKARSWGTALDEYMDYASTYAGLFESGSLDGVTLKLPPPQKLADLLREAQELADKFASKGNGRTAIMRTGFPGRPNPTPLSGRM